MAFLYVALFELIHSQASALQSASDISTGQEHYYGDQGRAGDGKKRVSKESILEARLYSVCKPLHRLALGG